jgi:hypothetical protein
LFFWCLIFGALYIFLILILCPLNSWQRFFSHYVGCLLILVIVSFDMQKLFKFDPSAFVNSCSYFLSNWVLFRKLLPLPISSSVFCSSFKVSGLTFISLIHFNFYRVRERGLASVLYMWIFSFPSTICWRGRLFSNYGLSSFVKNPMAVAVWAYFWIFHSIPLVYMFVFAPVLCCFCYYVCLQFKVYPFFKNGNKG